ncbi:M23 family metallopeptidase [Hufsiella ginkgonis]|uniref:M23 family metallopeptidase n=1 Tax=Hufsiella ginkgonis TaxID=2695274 RepID=UPI001F4743BB|nr:M23 family metallopeptidase [Hufsiella ginkgonis]
MDIPISLAGSFGEIRSNHFHSGLDLRTNQQEGLPVHAAADGYISRLRVQIGGGGNIVYINHGNGYTTVYMHLQRFSEKIASRVRFNQFMSHSFDIDFPLFPAEIFVKKGEVIALSGNTGGSAGPHLHFEIRDSKTEETINAPLFGIGPNDRTKPVISGLYLYRLNDLPFSERTPKQYFQVSGGAGSYRLNQSPVINIGGEAGVGIMTYDQSVPGGNKNGVYSIQLTLDGTVIYFSELERFSFSNSRAVNSHIDYPALLSSGRSIQKSFVEPGNPLTIYKKLVNGGRFTLTGDSIHNMVYTIKDVYGNTSTLTFKVKNNPKAALAAPPFKGVKTLVYNQDNDFAAPGMRVSFPKGIFYSNVELNYSENAKPAGAFSKSYQVHTRLIPVHDAYTLWIKPDSALRAEWQNKAVIVDSRGISQGGVVEDGFIKASPRYLGSFYVKIDTLAPVIRSLTLTEGKSLAGVKKIFFKISDNLSGIKTFYGSIDGQWVLMEYDLKTATLWHTFGESVTGNHIFKLVVTDAKGNEKTFTANFNR